MNKNATYLPRERVKKDGIHVLSDYELLALILKTGSKGIDVIACAKNVLEHIEGIRHLGHATIERLCHVNGIGESKAIALLAAIELGKRVMQAKYDIIMQTISNPIECVEYFCQEFKYAYQERLVTIFLNTKNQVLNHKEIFRGGLQDVVVHPREIFRMAVEISAASIILLHNHPSGDPKPSAADIQATNTLVQAGSIMGIPIIDHIIIAGDDFCSLKQIGVI